MDPDDYVRQRNNGSHRDRLLAGVREFPERAIIDAYQPYANGMETDPLYLLREFANSDKHRITEPGFARPHYLGVNAPPGYKVEVIPEQPLRKLKNRAKVLRYRLYGPPVPEGGVPVHTDVLVSVGFGPMAMNIMDIHESLARVDEIIRAF
jgi:hypothetical protein